MPEEQEETKTSDRCKYLIYDSHKINVSKKKFFSCPCFVSSQILQELLLKLRVDHVVWISDKPGNYYEVIFPCQTGDRCETMLHCLTQLGIGVRCRSIVR